LFTFAGFILFTFSDGGLPVFVTGEVAVVLFDLPPFGFGFFCAIMLNVWLQYNSIVFQH
jgi:hypothetical protein